MRWQGNSYRRGPATSWCKPGTSLTHQHKDILSTLRDLHGDIADNLAMPWKATDAMKERVNFVLEWERRWNEAQGGPIDMAELCRKFGVSRPTGYAWVKRFRAADHDVRAVEEKSRRPHSNPHAISAEVEDLVVQARKLMPRRGPRKLRAIMLDRYPEIEWPSTTSIGNILKRRGLCRLKKKRQRAPPLTQPFAETRQPNDTWCIDFKGKFRMQDGNWCHVLTLMDADTRYLLRAEPMLDPTGEQRGEGAGLRVSGIRPAQGDALRQRAALRLHVAQAGSRGFRSGGSSSASRSSGIEPGKPAAEWPSRALPSHARRGGDAVRRGSHRTAARDR